MKGLGRAFSKFDPQRVLSDLRFQNAQNVLQFYNHLPNKIQLTAGFDGERQDDDRWRFDNLDGSLGPLVFEQNEKVDSDGVYLHANYAVNDSWGLSVGLRYDEIRFNVVDRFLEDGDDSGVIRFDGLSPYIGVHVDLEGKVLFAS